MAKVTTWQTNTGALMNAITIRISHDLALSELVDGLCSKYIRHGDEEPPESLTPAKIIETVKEQYAHYGTNAVWTWVESGAHYMTNDEAREWAEGIIIAAFPGMGEHRA